MMELKIRQEREIESPQIYTLVQSAFEHAEHTDHDEQNLVERLRKSPAYIPALSLVAEMDGKLVGHIMFTEIKIGHATAITLAPLAVLPALQGKGIGGALIKAGHQIARDMGYPVSVLLGHENYYPRFGYLPASEFQISPPFPVPDSNYMAANLQDSKPQLSGTVAYAKEFFEK